MKEGINRLSLSDEIRIGFNCIKFGLKEFSMFGSTSLDVFIPLLLLSVGFERLLKVLYSINYYNENQKFPTQKMLHKKGHNLFDLRDEFINTCEKIELYHEATSRIEDLNYLKNNLDFQELLKILNSFSKEGRYYNLNTISSKGLYYNKPEELISKFLNNKLRNYPEIKEKAINPPCDSSSIYQVFNPIIIKLVQRFCKIVSYGFTQGAYGVYGRQVSAFYVNEFLSIDDKNLSSINFK